MAFANQTGNGAANPFTTEKDLIRQVASNMTKEALIVKRTDAEGATSEHLNAAAPGESKKLMSENSMKCVKVW